jgi:hypothetical protein
MQFPQHPRADGLHYHAAMARNWKNSTLAERVEYILKEMGWKEAQMTREIGASEQSTIQHWTTGRNKTMARKFARCLQTKYRWNELWIHDGEGEPRIDVDALAKERVLEKFKDLPLERLKALAAGAGLKV